METAAEEGATVTLTTLVAVTVDLAEGETGAEEALADSAVIVTADLVEETVTGALEEGLMPRPSETELLLTKRALKTNFRGTGAKPL